MHNIEFNGRYEKNECSLVLPNLVQRKFGFSTNLSFRLFFFQLINSVYCQCRGAQRSRNFKCDRFIQRLVTAQYLLNAQILRIPILLELKVTTSLCMLTLI